MPRLPAPAVLAAGALIAAGIGLAGANLTDLSLPWIGVVMITANLLPVLAIVGALRVYRPARPVAWWALVANTTLLTVGYALFYLPVWTGGELPGVPSLADLAWWPSYPPLIAALALALARRESLSFALIDIAAVSLALMIVVSDVLIGPYLSRGDLPLDMRLVQCSYALFDVLVAVGALRLLLSRRGHSGAGVLLALSSLAYVASDVGWNWMLLLGRYAEGSWLSTGWILAGALLAAAAVLPSMQTLSQRETRVTHRLSWRNAALLAVSPLLAPVVLGAHLVVPGLSAPEPVTVLLVVASSVGLAGVGALRVSLLIREGRRLSAELETALSEQGRRLERSEVLYRDLVEQLPGVVFISVSAGGPIELVYVSPQVEPMLGVAPEACLADATRILDAVHPDDRDAVLAHTLAQHAGEHPPALEYRCIRADGTILWVRQEATAIDDPETGMRCVQGILLDISEWRRAQEERDRMESDLRLAQKLEAVGQLAAGVAHEINTPIQYVGDTVAFLEDAFGDLARLNAEYRALCPADADALADAEEAADLDYLRERVPVAFDRARDGVERVSRIVGAMRQFAHPTTRDMAPADLNAALESTLTVARSEYKYVADVEIGLGALPPVVCNVGDLNQVFLNLLVNAAHAIEDVVGDGDRRGAIIVSTRAEGDEAVIRIADTGGGIPAEVADRVFDPFFTTKPVGRGTGQGLAIAHRIVTERHGGTLSFTSQPGQGTVFEIRLPAAGPEVTRGSVDPHGADEGGADRRALLRP